MTQRAPGVNADGSLFIKSRLRIPATELALRATTSGGPGGQHANRTLSKVIATFVVTESMSLSKADRQLLDERGDTVFVARSSRYRSQVQNKNEALELLAKKIALALQVQPTRHATKPTKGSKVRRVDEKKARSQIKQNRRRPSDD